MPFGADLCELKDEMVCTRAASPQLMAKFIECACRRLAMPGYAAKTARINQLIDSQAWTEAALALVELEVPQWKLRRLVCEEGIWLCSLSRQWDFPDWLADQVESRHEALPLAILGAVIETRQCSEAPPPGRAGAVPQCRGRRADSIEAPVEILCCDNFG
jgi:hypothetical protein